MPSQMPYGDIHNPHEGDCANHILLESRSPAIRALDRIIAEIAPTEIPILLVGENGTGKEVIARQIHRLSARRRGPFVRAICADLRPDVLTTLLLRGDDGTLSPSRAGTVFFDEVSELDLHLQNKLLHLLPDGDLSSNGSALNARCVAATSRDLETELRSGRFRQDLYYRLNGVCLRLPSLCQRKEDIPALVGLFASKYAPVLRRPVPSVSDQTMRVLVEYSWPGNIRQLENIVRRIVALGDEELVVSDLLSVSKPPAPSQHQEKNFSLKEASRAASRQAERSLILRTLTRTRWNRKKAAQELQISYKALLYKLKQLDLDTSEKSEAHAGEFE